MSYAILRTKKLKSASEIARVGRHNEREQPTLNADSERTQLNIDYRPEVTGPLIDRVRRRIGDRQHRKDAVLAVEALMAYSPEAEHALDPLAWGIASVDWLEAEFGAENVVSARLHRDEKTVHVQCCIVPIDPNDRLNCKHFLGSPRKLAALQTRYAAAVARFGLKRGEEGSKRKHVPIRDLYRDANLLKDESDKTASLIESLRTPAKLRVPEKRLLESHREYEKRVNDFVRELLLRLWQQLQDSLVRLLEAGRNMGLLKAERSARVAAIKRARDAEKRVAIAERRVAKAERTIAGHMEKISTLEILVAQRCRELSIADVARDLLKVKSVDAGAKAVFTTRRHRLVVANDRFEVIDLANPATGVVKGKNAIDLVIALMRCKYSRAVEYLASRYDIDAVRETCVTRAEAKAATLCESPRSFTAQERCEALERPETLRPTSPPSKTK